jgi:hypothetical protein
MPAAFLPSDNPSIVVDRFMSEFQKPTAASQRATQAAKARARSGRKRRVDPTTSERDYSAAELEFMQAMQAYKQASGRMFPTWSEVLEVLRSLGYQKPPEAPTA